MSVKSERVKSGYTELSESEKIEVKEFIRKYDAASPADKSSLNESTRTYSNKSLGPKDSNSCPCCGR